MNHSTQVSFLPLKVIPAQAGIHDHSPPQDQCTATYLCLTPLVSIITEIDLRLMKPAFVYIMASGKNGTLYVGMTTNLVRRTYQHRHGLTGGFTQKYKVHRLVYYEPCDDIREAIRREKQLKAWKRDWKLRLIRGFNPEWADLYSAIAS